MLLISDANIPIDMAVGHNLNGSDQRNPMNIRNKQRFLGQHQALEGLFSW
jgi:hypothetical protein